MKRRELATMLVVTSAVALMSMGCRSRHHDAVDGTKKLATALTESQPATMNVAAPLPPSPPPPTPIPPSTSLTGIYTCFFCPGATVGSRVAIVTQSGNFVQITSGKTRTSCVNISGQLVCDVHGVQSRGKTLRANLVPNSRGELRGEYVSATGSHPFILLPKKA